MRKKSLPPLRKRMARLGVNIDHVATVRQARGEDFPSIIDAAKAAIAAGADGITAHLREDRRHIQDRDIELLKEKIEAPLNMEMACAPDIVVVAERVKPTWACFVPEKRKELTTEGGLDVKRESSNIRAAAKRLHAGKTRVSFFIDPEIESVRISKDLGADAVELHTGVYARLYRSDKDKRGIKAELKRLAQAAAEAEKLGLLVNVGHGLDYGNVAALLEAYPFHELNIGFAIVARALFVGLGAAVKEMKQKLG